MKIGILCFEHLHSYSYADSIVGDKENKLTAIFDENSKVRKDLKKRYPSAKIFDDYKKLLREADCEAVIVTSANTKHKKYAVDSAKAGKHILCEKPIATTLKDAQNIINECKKAGVVLMTAFPVRFAPAIKRAKEVILSGKLGKIYAVKTTNHGSMPGSWFVDKKLSGGGAIMDHTVHIADLLRYLLNREFTSVYAESTTKLYPLKVDDCGLLLFEMEGGIFGTLDTSWSRPRSYKIWGDVTLEFKGSKGNISVDCFPSNLHIFQNKTMKHSSFSGGDNYDLVMIKEFVKAIEEKREPFVTGLDGLKAVELAIGAYHSVKTREKVRLPLPD